MMEDGKTTVDLLLEMVDKLTDAVEKLDLRLVKVEEVIKDE